MSSPLIHVELIRSKLPRKQRWRWTAKNAGNHRIMATCGEFYSNRSDCVAAIYQVFGCGTRVVLRQRELGDVTVRQADQ